MTAETPNAGAAANVSDAVAAKAAAAVEAAPIVNVLTEVEKHYPGIKPIGRLGLKLLLIIVGAAALFTIAAAVRQKYFEWPPSPQLAITPKSDLPPYHQIQPSEVKAHVRLADNPEAETRKNVEDAIGRYTLEALPQGKPIAEAQLGPTVNGVQFSGKAVVEVPLTKERILDGELKAGDVVDVIFKSPPTQGQQQSQPLPNSSFLNIFVLNVKPIEKPDPTAAGELGKEYCLILALPLERHAEFVNEIAKKTPLTVHKKNLTE